MNEEELVSYVVRYCKHELSEEEYRFLQRWLEEKQENRHSILLLRDIMIEDLQQRNLLKRDFLLT